LNLCSVYPALVSDKDLIAVFHNRYDVIRFHVFDSVPTP
jgi:hypothetical protein